MDPGNIPFNALAIGPTNSGKSRFVVDQLCNPFRGNIDFIMLICPTFAYNKTLHRSAEGTDVLINLDDCTASKDVKKHTGQLVNLAFSTCHTGLNVWVLTQKMTSITASFRENVAAIVLFYTPSWKTSQAVFEDYASELSQDEYKEYILRLKKNKFSFLVFSLRHPYGIKLKLN